MLTHSALILIFFVLLIFYTLEWLGWELFVGFIFRNCWSWVRWFESSEELSAWDCDMQVNGCLSLESIIWSVTFPGLHSKTMAELRAWLLVITFSFCIILSCGHKLPSVKGEAQKIAFVEPRNHLPLKQTPLWGVTSITIQSFFLNKQLLALHLRVCQ